MRRKNHFTVYPVKGKGCLGEMLFSTIKSKFALKKKTTRTWKNQRSKVMLIQQRKTSVKKPMMINSKVSVD